MDAAWRAKYGHPFTAAAATAAITPAFATVRQGPAVVADPKAVMATGAEPRVDGREVTIAASDGLPKLTVPMVRETPDGWKVDVPDTVDAPALRQHLSDEVAAALSTQAQWPADEAEAYRLFTHRVLLAVMGKPLPPNN